MKTKEFIRKVEELDFVGTAEKGMSGLIGFPNKNGEALISVNEDLSYHFNTDYKAFRQLHLRDKRQLANIAWEYASTPLVDRGEEEEKKYRYKFPFRLAVTEIEKEAHLRKEELRKNLSFIVVDTSGVDFAKKHSDFHFTDKEVEQYTGKDRALFNVCEKIEVDHDLV